MTLYAEFAGQPVFEATVVIPRRGMWTADLLLTDAPISSTAGKLTLTIAGLSLVGTVVRGNPFQDDYKARMVGGAGGWRRVIGPKAYRSAAGLKRGPILKDAAREAGEEIEVTDDGTIGQFYVRARDAAARVLDRLYPNWWMGADGKVRISARPTSNVSTAFELIAFNPGLGRYDIATERPESFVPGARFAAPTISPATVNLVVHQLSKGKLRTVVYAS